MELPLQLPDTWTAAALPCPAPPPSHELRDSSLCLSPSWPVWRPRSHRPDTGWGLVCAVFKGGLLVWGPGNQSLMLLSGLRNAVPKQEHCSVSVREGGSYSQVQHCPRGIPSATSEHLLGNKSDPPSLATHNLLSGTLLPKDGPFCPFSTTLKWLWKSVLASPPLPLQLPVLLQSCKEVLQDLVLTCSMACLSNVCLTEL